MTNSFHQPVFDQVVFERSFLWYLIKGGISALRLSRLFSRSPADSLLHASKDTSCYGLQDSLYRLTELIEVYDAMIGENRSGKRDCGARRKTSVLIGCENRGKKAGFIAI
ncbi:MAG: hypothetical protein EHM49_06965 [Deltaproteobacteria bacterium]|nr:MAG: hypothetical protein EHM49_06965 [Deltaproteobacteria bacterium]